MSPIVSAKPGANVRYRKNILKVPISAAGNNLTKKRGSSMLNSAAMLERIEIGQWDLLACDVSVIYGERLGSKHTLSAIFNESGVVFGDASAEISPAPRLRLFSQRPWVRSFRQAGL